MRKPEHEPRAMQRAILALLALLMLIAVAPYIAQALMPTIYNVRLFWFGM